MSLPIKSWINYEKGEIIITNLQFTSMNEKKGFPISYEISNIVYEVLTIGIAKTATFFVLNDDSSKNLFNE